MNILMASVNWPFALALAIVVLLGLLEVVGMLLGGTWSFFDNDVAVDVGGATPDAEGGFDGIDSDGAIGQVLDWLHVGKIPATVLLIVFLTAFGACGLLVQTVLKSQNGTMLPTLLASGIAFLLALPATRLGGGILKPMLPRDESEAVSRESFVGCEAQIVIGTSSKGKPAEARLRDKFGRSHYVMVEPEDENATFSAGHHVLILKRHGDTFLVVDNAHGVLE